MFMWKKGASDDEVATVLKNSKLLDRAKSELAPLVHKRNEYKDRFAKVKFKSKEDQPDETPVDIVEYPRLLKSLPGKQKQLTKAEKDLKDIQDKVSSAQLKIEGLKNQNPQSDDTTKQIEQLCRQIEQLNKQSGEKSKKAEELKTEVNFALKQQAAVTSAGLEAQVEEWKKDEEKLAQKREVVSNFTGPIDESAWVFNSQGVSFKFEFARDKRISVSIRNWKLSDTGTNDPEIVEKDIPNDFTFSTEFSKVALPNIGYEPTIRNVAYEPMGGIFTFEVYTSSSVYWFKIARTKYKLEGDGRLYFKGEILRCSVENGYGWPVVEYVRDIVQCGVSTDGAPVGLIDRVGTPVIRRGAANFVDKDDLK